MDNLICLDIEVHSIFDHNTLLLKQLKFNNIFHLIFSIYIESYGLSVNYPESLSILQYLLLAKISIVQEKWPQYNDTQVELSGQANWRR